MCCDFILKSLKYLLSVVLFASKHNLMMIKVIGHRSFCPVHLPSPSVPLSLPRHYELKRNDDIVSFFNDFSDHLAEEALWELSLKIKIGRASCRERV